jgi:hypothetical protein
LNERIIELIDIAPKDFWGAQDTHLETIKRYYPKLKIVARGTTLKAFGEKEVLDEFENRFNRLMLHFTRYNTIDDNVIERVIQSTAQEDAKTFGHDKILVHGVGGKIIKPMTPKILARMSSGRCFENKLTATVQMLSIIAHNNNEPSWPPQTAAIRNWIGSFEFELVAT